jgi:hypothetical protein
MKNIKLVILDNDTNRAGGGFWTTYWMFAPLLLTSSAPTPSNTSVPVVDTAYEYNVNSDAPTYPINLLADVNSLVAYGYDYGAQGTAPMPAAALQPVAPGAQHYHYVVAPDGTVVNKVAVNGNITYVTFATNGLPLLAPLRMIPGGNVVADAVEPTLTVLVNWGYQDNSPIPQDPGVTRPVGLVPPPAQDAAAVAQLPGAVQQGVQTAQKQVPVPAGLVTTPPAAAKPAALPAQTVNMTTGNKASPAPSVTTTSSSGGVNPAAQVGGGFSSALAGVVGSLTPSGQKNTPGSSGSSAPSH